MNKAVFIILPIAFVIYLSACRRPSTHVTPKIDTPYHPLVPYSTDGIAGVFILQKIVQAEYSEITTGFFSRFISTDTSVGGLVWYGHDSVSQRLRLMDGHFSIAYAVGWVGFDTAILWHVSGTTASSLSFNDVSLMPHFIGHIMDTIPVLSGATLYVDSVANADTLTVAVYDYNPGACHISHVFPVASDSLVIEPNELSEWAGNIPVTLMISAYRHQYVAINGVTYLFVKEYRFQKYVQLK